MTVVIPARSPLKKNRNQQQGQDPCISGTRAKEARAVMTAWNLAAGLFRGHFGRQVHVFQ